MNREEYYKLKLKMDQAYIQKKVMPNLALSAVGNRRFNMDSFLKDANESFFLQRELTLLEAKAIEWFPTDMTSRKLFTVENVGSGISSINYAEIIRSGRAVFSGEKDTAIPNANARRTETPSPVRKGKIKYTITLEEMEAAMFSGQSIDTQKALAAKEGVEYLLNQTAWFGDKANGLKGFFTHMESQYLEAISPTNGTSGQPYWAQKTAAEIWADLVKLKKSSDVNTNGQIVSNVLAVGVESYNILAFTTFTDTIYQGRSILERIQQTGIFDRVEKCPELTSVTNAKLPTPITSKSVAVAYSDRPDVFKLHHPLEFTTLPMEIEGFDTVVYCHANTAGLFMYRKYGGAFLINV